MYSNRGIWSAQGFEPLGVRKGARAMMEAGWLVGSLEQGPVGLNCSPRSPESTRPQQGILWDGAESGMCSLLGAGNL